jgi:hypothetical protein
MERFHYLNTCPDGRVDRMNKQLLGDKHSHAMK